MRETENGAERGERLIISTTSYNDRDPVMLTHKHTKGQTDTEHRFGSVTVIFGLSTVVHAGLSTWHLINGFGCECGPSLDGLD